MSDIYLIRHGFTPANNVNYNHQTNMWKIAKDEDMPLEIKYGREQAKEVGRFLNNIEGKSLILVSPYKRTRETLELALTEMHGDYDVRICNDIHEIESGIHYARSKEEVLEVCKEAEKFYKDFDKDPYTTKFIGGESYADVKKRTENIVKEILDISNKNIYKNIFIFAHGEVNRWIYHNINNELYDIKQKNGEIIIANGNSAGKTVFIPKAFVPKGYVINIEDYKGIC